jgi:hypothetical protein
VQEIRQVGLPKAGLAGQQGDTERTPLYPAQQFQAEPFMHLRKIHLWKIRHQQWREWPPFSYRKAIRAVRPTFSMSLIHLNSAVTEKRRGRLTQENRVSRLASLTLAQVVGNLLGNVSMSKG